MLKVAPLLVVIRDQHMIGDGGNHIVILNDDIVLGHLLDEQGVVNFSLEQLTVIDGVDSHIRLDQERRLLGLQVKG